MSQGFRTHLDLMLCGNVRADDPELTPEQKMERRRAQAKQWLEKHGLWCLAQPVQRKVVEPSPLMLHKMRMVEARGAK